MRSQPHAGLRRLLLIAAIMTTAVTAQSISVAPPAQAQGGEGADRQPRVLPERARHRRHRLSSLSSSERARTAGSLAQGDLVYVSTSSSLYLADTSTGALTYIGSYDHGAMFDIALAPNGAMYGVAGGGASLVAIDEGTGDTTYIGPTRASINGLTVAADGTLFGSGSDRIYTLNPASGTATLVGSTGGFHSAGDLAGGPPRTMYLGSDVLARVDPASGQATAVGTTSIDCLYGLADTPAGLIGATCAGELLVIDQATGAYTVIDDTGPSWYGMAAAPVTPPALAERAFTATWVGTGRSDHRTRLEARAVDGASYYSWHFGDGTQDKRGRTITHDYANPREYTVKLTVGFPGGVTRSRTLTIAANPVVTYAPLVYLHKDETRRPSSAADFVNGSSLWWRYDNGSDCPGDAKDLESGDPQSGQLGSGGYGHQVQDEESCDLVGPSFTTNQHTAPGQGADLPAGEKGEGFYLDIPSGMYGGDRPADVPAYYEFEPGRYVIYWFFYPYNDHLRVGQHEGDWEHIAVRLDDLGLGTRFAYYVHDCAPKVLSRAQMADGPGIVTGFSGSSRHPIVYSAIGSHASAWKPVGRKDTLACQKGDAAQKGPKWETWRTLRDARTQGWYGYGGAWGPYAGVIGRNGPVGPSEYKLGGATPDW